MPLRTSTMSLRSAAVSAILRAPQLGQSNHHVCAAPDMTAVSSLAASRGALLILWMTVGQSGSGITVRDSTCLSTMLVSILDTWAMPARLSFTKRS